MAAGVFFVIVVAGLFYAFSGDKLAVVSEAEPSVVVPAVSMIDYQSEALSAVAPLFSRVTVSEDWPDAELLDAARSGRDRLLDMRVPAAARDTHMQTFLLFENWVKALESGQDTAVLRIATNDLIAAQPWLSVTASVIRPVGE